MNINGQKVDRVIIANTWVKRLTGLLFTKPDSFDAIWISPCKSVHTIGMRYNIDVVFVNKENEVVGLEANLTPLRVCNGPKSSQSTVELPVGGIARYDLGLGCKISL